MNLLLRLLHRVAVCIIPIVLMAAIPASSRADELGDAVRAAVKVVDPSLVRIRVIGGEQQVDGDTVTSLVTTGIVISESGEILTSLFALQGNPEAVLAEDMSGNRTNLEIVATDQLRRLVLLKAREGRWTPAAAASDSVKVGQWSIALGRFYAAQSSSVSVGIVSAVNRVHGMAIQTDAKISPVNYGGPLIDLQGQVLGILVPLSPRGQGNASSGIEWYDSGIGFAIPMEKALQIAERLRSGKDLKPGRLGVKLATAGMFSSDIRVERVLPTGPADIAGLKKGDQLVAANGRPIERVSILEEAVASSYAADSVTLDVKRGTETLSLTIELAAELPVVTRGYLGFMTVRTGKSEDARGVPAASAISRLRRPATPPGPDSAPPEPELKAAANPESDSVPLVVVNETPAAKAGLPVRIELMKLNDTRTSSLGELIVAMSEVQAGGNTRIEYRIVGETEPKSAEIAAEEQPQEVIRLTNEVLSAIRSAGEAQSVKAAEDAAAVDPGPQEPSVAGEVQRKELPFEERGRCVVFSSTLSDGVLPGIVILLSTQGMSEEQILQEWKPVLDSHKLVVAIPVNPEQSVLTADDIPLVRASIRGIAAGSGADLRRIVVVAAREQSRLAWQLTFGGPSPIRGIALTDGWLPSNEFEGTDGSGSSVLLLESPPNAQAKALLTQCVEGLRKSGFWVARPANDDAARTIADWSLLLRSF